LLRRSLYYDTLARMLHEGILRILLYCMPFGFPEMGSEMRSVKVIKCSSAKVRGARQVFGAKPVILQCAKACFRIQSNTIELPNELLCVKN
jgi:hypothetical protein